jgi:hypothetical protein
MTKIKIKSKTIDVHSHIKKAFTIIDSFLPKTYVDKVLERAPEEIKLYAGLVRNVRNRVPGLNVNNHVQIVQLLVEVAKENKKNIENLEKSIQ